jgi:hypothetical protein
MQIYCLAFLLVIIFCVQDISSRVWHSEDHLAMDEITKSIGPKNDRTLYFLRPNGVIPYESITGIIKNLIINDFDSIRVEMRPEKDFCGYFSSGHKIKHYSFALYLRRLLKYKHYSFDVYVDTTINLLAVSSQKWQYGFIEPPEKNNRFASKTKDKLLEKYTNAEYIGCTEMKYNIKESDSFVHQGEVRFWKWFKKYEKYLFEYEMRSEIIDKYIKRKLQIIEVDLSFEIDEMIDNKRKLIIYGPEYLRERVVKTVPKLQFWQVQYITGTKKNMNEEDAREEIKEEDGGEK